MLDAWRHSLHQRVKKASRRHSLGEYAPADQSHHHGSRVDPNSCGLFRRTRPAAPFTADQPFKARRSGLRGTKDGCSAPSRRLTSIDFNRAAIYYQAFPAEAIDEPFRRDRQLLR